MDVICMTPLLYANPAWWNKLAPAHRQAIEAAAAKTERDAIEVTEATAAAALKDLQGKGMAMHVQDAQERQTLACPVKLELRSNS